MTEEEGVFVTDSEIGISQRDRTMIKIGNPDTGDGLLMSDFKGLAKLNVILERELLIGGRTVGGGTTLPAQAAFLEAIGCEGAGRTADEN